MQPIPVQENAMKEQKLEAMGNALVMLKKRGTAANTQATRNQLRSQLLSFPPEVLTFVDNLYEGTVSSDAAWTLAQDLFREDSVTEILPPKCLTLVEKLVDAFSQSRSHSSIVSCTKDLTAVLRDNGCQTLFRWIHWMSETDGATLTSAWMLLQYLRLRAAQVVALLDRQPVPPGGGSDPEQTFIPNTYDPPRMRCAYYFTPKGWKYREMQAYKMDSQPKSTRRDPCTKRVPRSATESYVFFIFCPGHGHCWGTSVAICSLLSVLTPIGFHVIDGGEGRSDFFKAIYEYMPTAPKTVFYDFSCSLSEFCLNREGQFFKDTKFFHDVIFTVRKKVVAHHS
jgi:hypothetical protein